MQIPLSICATCSFFLPLRNNYTAVKRDRRATSSLLVLDRRYRSPFFTCAISSLPAIHCILSSPLSSPLPGNYLLRPSPTFLHIYIYRSLSSSLFVGISRTNRIPGFTVRFAAVGNVRHVCLHACTTLSHTACGIGSPRRLSSRTGNPPEKRDPITSRL